MSSYLSMSNSMFSGTGSYLSSIGFTDSVESSYLFWPLLVFVIMIIIFIIIMIAYRAPPINDYMPTMVSLAEATYPISSNEAHKLLLSGPGSTLAGLFNVTIGDRTNQLATSNTNNFTTLFGMFGSIEFQIAPANISTTDSTARLLIKTAVSESHSNGTEVVPLPPLPAQKWIFIGILRDGRRYDVLYNDKIVASHRLDAFPDMSIQNQLQVGANPPTGTQSPSRFLGNAIHLIALPYRMNPKDLATLRAQYVDTTGGPPTPLPFPFPINLPTLQSLCIPGLPCTPVNKPPPNRLQAWSSPYA